MAVDTAEQRAAKLAELRRLTPEQEAAAAKAAQRIDTCLNQRREDRAPAVSVVSISIASLPATNSLQRYRNR